VDEQCLKTLKSPKLSANSGTEGHPPELFERRRRLTGRREALYWLASLTTLKIRGWLAAKQRPPPVP
jgi:hypothetical protein